MKEFLKSLGIELAGRYTDDDEYIVDIPDSNTYSKIYSILDASTKLHELEDDSVFDVENNTLYYQSEKYELQLDADLESDTYSLTLREKVED